MTLDKVIQCQRAEDFLLGTLLQKMCSFDLKRRYRWSQKVAPRTNVRKARGRELLIIMIAVNIFQIAKSLKWCQETPLPVFVSVSMNFTARTICRTYIRQCS